MKYQLIGLLLLLSIKTVPQQIDHPMIPFDLKKAEYLYHFAFDCIDREYPNKPGSVLGDATYLKQPHEEHPAFYGCFDWHSSVHGHWTLVTLLANFPDFEQGERIIAAFGKATTKAAEKDGLNVQITAPTKTAPSMTMAIQQYLESQGKK